MRGDVKPAEPFDYDPPTHAGLGRLGWTGAPSVPTHLGRYGLCRLWVPPRTQCVILLTKYLF
jgi:hypothetical protein